MANDDKLWFELGVRDNVTSVIDDIMKKAEQLGVKLNEAKLEKNFITNAENLERAYDKIAVAINRIHEARSKTSNSDEIKRLKEMEKEINKTLRTFQKLEKNEALMASTGTAAFERLRKGFQLSLEQIMRYTNEIDAEAKADERNKAAESRRVDELKGKYYELYRLRKEMQDAILTAAPGTDTSSVFNMMQGVNARLGAVKRAEKNGGELPQSVVGADSEEFLRRAREKTRELTSATEDYNRKLTTTEGILASLKKQELDTESQQKIAGIRKQTTEYNALANKLQEIKNLEASIEAEQKAIQNGTIKTPKYTREVVNEKMDAIQRSYNEAVAKGNYALNQQSLASRKAADAIQLLAHANQGLISSYNRIAEAGSRAYGVSIQIGQQIGQYASLYGIERILKSVITIGGQFEVQHVALQNILGDLNQANALFGQLQTLAVESPKTFMELTAYTKQLSAYQIPYEELYDTTKRLADLSSGLGVDMSRLILAYGQVRSASVLRGQELRQFTEAGIPLVEKLAEKFSDLNGKAITTGDVFDLISKRAVSFEMVKDILWEMTSEGGQFFNMQSELADTLFGKWQKLQDQWQITLGHIAEGKSLTGALLKNILEGLVGITSAVDTILPILGALGAVKALNKGFHNLSSFVEKQTGESAVSAMKLAKEKEANRLMRERIVYGKQLSAEEHRIVVNKDKLLASELRLFLLEGKITERQIMQMANAGKIEKLEALRCLRAQGYTIEQLKQIKNGNLQILQGERFITKLGKGAWSMIGGWWGIAATAIGSVISLYGDATNKVEEAKTAATGANDALMSSLKDANTLYDQLTKKSPTTNEETTNAIERITNALKESGVYSEEFQQKVDAASDNAQKYNILYTELKRVSDEYLRAKDNVEAYLASANRVGEGNWFTKMFKDPMSEDLKDWSNAIIEKNVAAKGVDKFGKNIRMELEAYLKETNKWVADEMAGMDWKGLFGKVNAERFVNRLKNDRNRDWDEEVDAINRYRDALSAVGSAEEEVDGQMNEYINHITIALESRAKLSNLDFSKLKDWKQEDLQKLSTWITDVVNSYNLDGETAEKLRDKILKFLPKEVTLKINTLPVFKKDALSGWQQDLKNYFDTHKADGKVVVPIDAKSSLESVEKELQDKRKEWQEQMDRSGKILVSVGLDLKNLPADFNSVLDTIPVWQQNLAKKAYGDYKEGKTGVETVDKAGKDLGLSVEKQKKSGSGHKEDKTLKMWNKRIELLEKYRKALEDLEKYMSRTDADAKLRENKNFDALWGYFGNPNDYKGSIDKAIGAMGKNPKGERQNFVDSLNAKKESEDMRVFEEETKAAVEELQKMLGVMSENYETYKKWVELTGDTKLAASIAGIAENASFSSLLTDEMEKALSEAKKNNKASDVFAMKEADVAKLGKDSAIFKIWEEWQKNQKKVKKETLAAYEEAMKAAKDYEDKIADINRNLQKQIDLIQQNPELNQEQKDKAINQLNKDAGKKKASLTWENFKENEDWGRIFADLDRVSGDTIDHLLIELEKVAPTITEDVEAVKALYEAMEKLREQQEQRSPFKAITQSLSDQKKIAAYRNYAGVRQVDSDMARILGLTKGSIVNFDDKKIKAKVNDASANADKSFLNGLKNIEAQFKSLQDVLKPVIDLFDAMGSKTLSDIFSAGSNALGSAANTANAFSSLTQAFGGEKSPIGGLLKSAGPWGAVAAAGLSLVTSAMGMFGADYDEYNKMKEQYEGLINVWDDLIGKKKQYLSESWGTEAKNAGKEALSILQSEVEQTKVVAKARLDSGSSWGSHSIWYRMWKGSYKYNGQNWQDVAGDISRQLNGVKFTEMEDMLNMTSEQLLWIKENYSGLWATMDGDFKEYLEKLIEYGDAEKEILDELQKKLTGMDYDEILSSWSSLLSTMSNGIDALADDLESKLRDAILNSMMSNLYGERIKELIEKADKYAKNNDKMYQNDKILSEYTAKEYEDLMADAKQIAEDSKNSRDFLKEAFGWKDSGGSSSTNAIGKAITEQDTNLWSSYLNAIRLDVSVNRINLEKIIQEVAAQHEMPEIAKAQLTQLNAIAENTKQNVKLVSQIYNLLHGVAPDGSAFKVK